MFTKTKKTWVFYYLNEVNQEVITSYKECKTPNRTLNHLVNQLRQHRFDNVIGCGYRTLFEGERSYPKVDYLTPKIIQNCIGYNKNLIMDKNTGVVYNCKGEINLVE
jgi:hypothetical protein